MGWSTQQSAARIIEELRAQRADLARYEQQLRDQARTNFGGTRGFTVGLADVTRTRIRDLERELAECG